MRIVSCWGVNLTFLDVFSLVERDVVCPELEAVTMGLSIFVGTLPICGGQYALLRVLYEKRAASVFLCSRL